MSTTTGKKLQQVAKYGSSEAQSLIAELEPVPHDVLKVVVTLWDYNDTIEFRWWYKDGRAETVALPRLMPRDELIATVRAVMALG